MKMLRLIHLYLGCFFAPLLLFFVGTGATQVFDLHESKKDGSYRAPAVLEALSEVHLHQRLPGRGPERSMPFRWFSVVMALGIVTTTALGIIMAFRFSQKPRVVWGMLAAGTLLPAAFLWLGSGPGH